MTNRPTNEDIDMGNVRDTYFGPIDDAKKDYRDDEAARRKVEQAMRRLDWREVKFQERKLEEGARYCYVVLPSYQLNAVIDGNAYFGDDRYGDWVGTSSTLLINKMVAMKLDPVDGQDNFQRSHFPNGIPEAMRGMGLGVKFYRALLEHAGFMRSDNGATDEAARAWISMVTNKLEDGKPTKEHVCSIMAGHNILAISPSLPDEEKLSIAKRFLDEYGKMATVSYGSVFDADPIMMALLKEKAPDYLARYDPDVRAEGAYQAQNRRRLDLSPVNDKVMRSRIRQYALHDEDDHHWNVGDYIVRRDQLVRARASDIPVYQIVSKAGDVFSAVEWADVNQYAKNADFVQPITTRYRKEWVTAKRPVGAPPAGVLPPALFKRVSESYEQFVLERVNPALIPDSYLGALADKRRKLTADAPPSYMQRLQAKDHVIQMFRNLDWRELKFHIRKSAFSNMDAVVLLPAKLLQAIEDATMSSGDLLYYGKWMGMKGVGEYGSIYMQYELEGDGLQRTHFQSGIPEVLRGVGFGVKLYRALLETVGYLSSSYTAKEPAQRAWLSLVTNRLQADGTPLDSHVHSIVIADYVLSISPTAVPDDKKVELAKQFMDEHRIHFEPSDRSFDIDPPLRTLLQQREPEFLAEFTASPS